MQGCKNMANCETCKKVQNVPESVQYIVHESEMARAERTAKRLWITILVLIFMLVGTNSAWLWYNSQFETVETVTEEYQADASYGGNAIINCDGSVDIDG